MKPKIVINEGIDLKKMIIDNGYSLASFARKSGITRNYLSTISNGHIMPSVSLAAKIERNLNVDLHSIFSVTYVQKSTQKT